MHDQSSSRGSVATPQLDGHTPAGYRERGLWPERSFVDDFLDQVERRPDQQAVVAYRAGIAEPSAVSYGELGRLVDRFAGALLSLGVQEGDVVSLQLPNGWEVAALSLATLRAGAIPNPLPPLLRGRELRFMLAHARSKVLVVPSTFREFSHAELGTSLADEIPSLEHVVVIGTPVPAGAISFDEQFLGETYETQPQLAPELQRRRPSADDIAVLLYTSGTTGVPKAAIHSHNTLWSAGRALPEALGLTDRDAVFMASTIGHLTGFYWGMLLPLTTGQKVVYQDQWKPDVAVRILERDRVTWSLSATPFALDLVEAQRQHRCDLDAFRAFVCGGAPIPAAVAGEVKRELGVDLVALWGMTEVGICTIHSPGAPLEILASSDGMPVDHMQVRIVDASLQPVTAGEEGRLQVRGPSVCVGYLRQPDLYAEAQTPDGWFDTGDLGRQVPYGGIRISGRSKDIIIRGGENIPVAEIESTLFSHPQVREVAVVGYPDRRLGERGCAVVVPQGAPPSLDDLKQHLEQIGMAKQYWPERLEIVDEMPKTPAGKIKKFVLRQRLADDATLSESRP